MNFTICKRNLHSYVNVFCQFQRFAFPQTRTFAGHSKWKKIKYKKGAADLQRGVVFAKLSNEIIAAAKAAGGDVNNIRLATALERAKVNNMPKENITNALKKGTDPKLSGDHELVFYEGYGPGGVAAVVECLTDNRKRTAPAVRHILSKHGGNLGATGCVSWMFERKWSISFETSNETFKDKTDEEAQEMMMNLALEVGAEDVRFHEDAVELITSSDQVSKMRDALVTSGYNSLMMEHLFIPKTTVELTEDHIIEQLLDMLECFEENADIQHIHHNADKFWETHRF